MNVKIRLSRDLEAQIRTDLLRPHEYERVGFVSGPHAQLSVSDYLVILNQYHPVSDNEYIEDHTVGARINGTAIRKAMQYVLDTRNGMFHVHCHGFKGIPELSRTDENEIPPVVQNFRNVDRSSVNGILLLNNTHLKAYVSLPSRLDLIQTTNISIVGFPLFLDI